MIRLTTRRLAGFCALAALMVFTRSGHLGTAWSPPDASWAVLYLAGFYFGREWRWALPTLICTATAVDCVVIRDFGISSYCVTGAYAFILPAYAMLWLGGAWLRREYRQEGLDALRCAASFAVAASLCFLTTNASFYWLGGRVSEPSLAGWSANFAEWYPGFLGLSFIYIAMAAVLHAVLGRSRASAAQHLPS